MFIFSLSATSPLEFWYSVFLLYLIQVSPGKGGSNKEVIMVDPLEAKRLAAKQMAKIKAKEKFKVKKFTFLLSYK